MKFDPLSAAKHAGVYKSRAPGHRGHCILYSDTQYLWALNTDNVFHYALLTRGILRWLLRFLEYLARFVAIRVSEIFAVAHIAYIR
jgi:hypothetical protein